MTLSPLSNSTDWMSMKSWTLSIPSVSVLPCRSRNLSVFTETLNQFFYRFVVQHCHNVPLLMPYFRKLKQPGQWTRWTLIVSGPDCRLMPFESVNGYGSGGSPSRDCLVLLSRPSRSISRECCGDFSTDSARLSSIPFACWWYDWTHEVHHVEILHRRCKTRLLFPSSHLLNAASRHTDDPWYLRPNIHKIVPINKPAFGRIMAVCVGAMMVGSIQTTVEEGEQVKRGKEFGYLPLVWLASSIRCWLIP